jgi:hypothetical protein
MSDPQWRGESNSATRRRIERIRWNRYEKISALLMGGLILLVGLFSGWLVANFRD